MKQKHRKYSNIDIMLKSVLALGHLKIYIYYNFNIGLSHLFDFSAIIDERFNEFK